MRPAGPAEGARARPGSAGAVRSAGDSAPEPRARPGRAPPTPRRRLPLLPRARRSPRPRPAPHPPASLRGSRSAEREGPQPRARRARTAGRAPGAPPGCARRLRGIPGPSAPSGGLSPRAPARPRPGAAARRGVGEERPLLSDAAREVFPGYQCRGHQERREDPTFLRALRLRAAGGSPSNPALPGPRGKPGRRQP